MTFLRTMLIQADLTRHASRCARLHARAVRGPRWRAEALVSPGGLRIVPRSPNNADIVYEHAPAGARFEVVENGPATGDAVVTTDIANRYLTIWGRRSAERPLTVDTDTVSAAVVESVLSGPALRGRPQGEQRSRTQHLIANSQRGDPESGPPLCEPRSSGSVGKAAYRGPETAISSATIAPVTGTGHTGTRSVPTESWKLNVKYRNTNADRHSRLPHKRSRSSNIKLSPS